MILVRLPYNPGGDGGDSFPFEDATNVVWFLVAAALAVSGGTGFRAIRRRQALAVFVSGLLLNVAGALVWRCFPSASFTALWQIQVVCLALGSAIWTLLGAAYPEGIRHVELAGRPLIFAHLAIQAAIGLFAFQAACGVVCAVLDRPPPAVQPLDWWALLAASAAVVLGLWDRSARFPLAGLYALGMSAVVMGKLQWPFTTGQFFIWAVVCDLAGFVLVAALLGWVLSSLKPLGAKLRIPHEPGRWSARWFHRVQAGLACTVAAVAVWVAMDFSFDGMGKEVALFGLAGRTAGCPAALMLIGTAILMAWQSRGAGRAGWQYAAMIAGVLFTSSIGWATLGATSSAPWYDRSVNLLISASMMTLLTSFGLARVLPRHSDWILRGRRAMPAFAGLALCLLAVVLTQRWL